MPKDTRFRLAMVLSLSANLHFCAYYGLVPVVSTQSCAVNGWMVSVSELSKFVTVQKVDDNGNKIEWLKIQQSNTFKFIKKSPLKMMYKYSCRMICHSTLSILFAKVICWNSAIPSSHCMVSHDHCQLRRPVTCVSYSNTYHHCTMPSITRFSEAQLLMLNVCWVSKHFMAKIICIRFVTDWLMQSNVDRGSRVSGSVESGQRL